MRLKTRFLACVLLVICLTVACQGTLAYFTAEDTARNVITTGGIDITLEETTKEGVAFKDVTGVMPGDTVSKIVTVTNEQAEAYVRAWVDVTAVHPEFGEVKAPMDLLLPGDVEIAIDFDTENWLYNEDDGHFYYKTALSTGETTEPLFTEVSFDAEGMDNVWQNCELVIAIQAEAVQTANNPEAVGWSECGHEPVTDEIV